MGIFDDFNTLQDDDTSQGGLIARLMQQAGVQSQYSPSAGFPSSPMDANASMPAPAALPIGIGNYQMPRIGPAAAFALPPGQIDPDTGEHVQPAAPAQQPAAAPTNAWSDFMNRGADALQSVARGGSLLGAIRGSQAPQSGGGIGDHLLAGMSNFAHGGAILPAIANGITGLATGQYDDPVSLQKQQLQNQFNAFRSIGATPSEAQIGVLNTDAAKALVAKYVGKDKNKFVQLKDGLGADHPVFVNEDAQTINGQSIVDYNKSNNTNASPGLGDTSLDGKDYLNSIPAQQRGTIQSMIDGRMAPPNGNTRKSPYWQAMISAANHVDPSFDEASWPARVTGMKSFKSGADAGTVRSANQVLGHISDLTDRADDLRNGDYPLSNYVKNTFNSATGSDAPNNWITQAHAVADELSSFMKGAGHSSDTEIKAWNDSLSENMSPIQQRGAIKTLMSIYDHALTALEDKRTGAVGSVAAERMGPLVTPAGQSAMDKVRKWSTDAAAPTPGKTSTGVAWSVVK